MTPKLSRAAMVMIGVAVLLGETSLIAAEPSAFVIRRVAKSASEKTESVQFYERDGFPEELHLELTPLLDGSDVASATVREGQTGPEVLINFTHRGADRFTRATEANLGHRLAILVQGVVKSAPVVRDPIIGGHAILSGLDDAAAKDLVKKLNSSR